MSKNLVLLMAAVLFTGHCASAETVIITNLPAYGASNQLAGVVVDAAPAAYKIAVFIYVQGYGWVTKPTCAQPLTSIAPDGSWSANIVTGGSDQLATRIAALLVSTNYNQPCVNGQATLSTNIYSQAIASAIVTRQNPGVRWLSFSGYDWWVKSSSGQVGPGPNYFSDSTSNLWVDAQDQVHVRITNRSNVWQCAELVSARTFGSGSYRFELNSRVDNLDPNVVLGLFTWSDDSAYADREIDIECGRWGNASDVNNAQFVVQPYNLSGHLVRFAVPAGLTNSTLLFTWQTNQVNFEGLRGSYVTNPPPQYVISNWNYSLTVPQSGDENVRINLWLMSGLAPSNQQEVEVVMKRFQFVPLASAQAATLHNATRLPGGQFRFTISTQYDRRYAVQTSTSLLTWQTVSTILATNTLIDFTDMPGPDRRFYRAVTLP